MLLITGITGHSGRYFLRELDKNNYKGPIRCVVRENSDVSLIDRSSLNIEKVVGDIGNQDFMNEIMEGIETVIHIASIFYSETVIKAAVNNGVNNAIFVHTTGIYSKYKSASKEYMEIESNIENIINNNKSNIDLIYLRPTMIYGQTNDKNMIVFIKLIDKLRVLPIINQGRNTLQPVNGRDLGKAYYQVLTNFEKLQGDYILSGEKPISMKELFILIGEILGKKTFLISVPLKLGVFIAVALKVISLGKVDYIEKVQRMGEDRSYSHEKAKNDFGYTPMSIREGLQIEIKEYLDGA